MERDYERAAEKKAERLRMEGEYEEQRAKWEAEHELDEVVDEDDIAEVVAQWTGIPVSQMMETEAEKLLNMEDRLHERIIGQRRSHHRRLRCHPPRALRAERPQTPDRLVHLHRPFRRGQDRAGQSAG